MASTPYSDIALPKLVTDPLYTSSQSSLDKLGTGLINGDVPDYYKPIGDFNSPQFQAMLNSVKGQIMQGSQESSAINGTGRSGVAVTASNNALSSILPQLTYQDYTRALAGRGALLNTGIGVEGGVRGSAQENQEFQTNFNQQLFDDQMKQASAIDSWKKSAAASTGQMIGNGIGMAASVGLAPFTGGASLLALPGFASGMAGGGSSGGTSDLGSLFNSLSKLNIKGSAPSSSPLLDESGLGSFGSLTSSNSSDLMKYYQ